MRKEIEVQTFLYNHLKKMDLNVALELYYNGSYIDIMVYDKNGKMVRGIEVKNSLKGLDFEQINKYKRTFGVDILPICGMNMAKKFRAFVKDLKTLKRICFNDLRSSKSGGVKNYHELNIRAKCRGGDSLLQSAKTIKARSSRNQF
jgi:hypothetical protein